jgi:hypothetical protein
LIDKTDGRLEGRGANYFSPQLIWLNVTCLDAPLVAIVWQWLFARSFRLAVPVANREALFLTAWLIYLSDRYVDSISLPAGVPKSARQEFCLNHSNVWLGLICIIASCDAGIIFLRLDHETVMRGTVLGGIAVCYLATNYMQSKVWEVAPIKEIVIGLLFASGTLLALRPLLFFTGSSICIGAILFVGLCSLNCISVATWESDLDRAQGKHSIATRWPPIQSYLRMALLILLIASCLLMLFDRHLRPICACLSVSASLLVWLHVLPAGRDERTALADLVLLTPLAFFAAEKCCEL